jgi:phospholipid transport system transporter-binding protein
MVANGAMTALPASLTLRDAMSALETLRQSFDADGGAIWRIDASSVTQLDTSALAVLLECARIAAAGQRKLEIVGATARLSDLAHLYGVDGLLGVAVARAEPTHAIGESVPPTTPVIPILR